MPRFTIADDTEAGMKTARGSRVRSEEVQELVDAVKALAPGNVKTIVIPKDMTPVKLRTKLTRAADICGVKLATTSGKDGKMYFTLRP